MFKVNKNNHQNNVWIFLLLNLNKQMLAGWCNDSYEHYISRTTEWVNLDVKNYLQSKGIEIL